MLGPNGRLHNSEEETAMKKRVNGQQEYVGERQVMIHYCTVISLKLKDCKLLRRKKTAMVDEWWICLFAKSRDESITVELVIFSEVVHKKWWPRAQMYRWHKASFQSQHTFDWVGSKKWINEEDICLWALDSYSKWVKGLEISLCQFNELLMIINNYCYC